MQCKTQGNSRSLWENYNLHTPSLRLPCSNEFSTSDRYVPCRTSSWSSACGLSLLFFAAFFIQCCRSASQKPQHPVSELSTSDILASAQTKRQLAQWEKEMAAFMARQARSTAPLFLMAMSSAALLSSTIPSVRTNPTFTKANQRSSCLPVRSASPGRSQDKQIPCKKN
jgi:hypothetical protein